MAERRKHDRRAPKEASRAKDADFGESLVLFRFLLSLFGDEITLDELCEGMKGEELEGWDEKHISFFCHHLTNRADGFRAVTREDLFRYDTAIYDHTEAITRKRPGFRWKYFQYMALLFTEIYLDRYFNAREGLLANLNAFLSRFNADRPASVRIPAYTDGDLNKIAFWQATGSGKTLIMHVNILQYRRYLEAAGRTRELNRVLLLTPNEGLSRQHETEMKLSGLNAELFSKDRQELYSGKMTEIIDIHKLKEEGKEKTVSVDSFENDNLVLVDEGHRGAGGEEWMDKRSRLCEKGFSFEYSATFGQAMAASKKKEMLDEYAKCILFDYSYKYFYKDGFGKDYRVLNLDKFRDREQKQTYLTACLLSYYQQLRIFDEQEEKLIPFNIEEPLWVFVGSKVTAVRKEEGRDVSDVVDILFFLKRFLSEREESVRSIGLILNGDSGLTIRGTDLFRGKFEYLLGTKTPPRELFVDIRKRVFNNPASGAELHIDNLKGIDGEIGLRLGNSDAHFGVINVGDDAKLVRLCEEKGFTVADREFAHSLFDGISSRHSTIKLLIGSKKFTEGWNSWRVSTLGLMNVGKAEGSEVIQLFGRGIRLKGFKGLLQRKAFVRNTPQIPGEIISPLETLNIFGVAAEYMARFRAYLDSEGVPDETDTEEITIPVISNLGKVKLKYPRLKRGTDFRRDAPPPILDEPDEWLKKHPVVLNCYPVIQSLSSRETTMEGEKELETAVLGVRHLAWLDLDRITLELEEYRRTVYPNLLLEQSRIGALLSRSDWYRLYIPSYEMELDSFSRLRLWHSIAVGLLRKYMDSFYLSRRMDYEKDKIEFKSIADIEQEIRDGKGKGNIFDEYSLFVEKSKKDIVEKLRELKGRIEKEDFEPFEYKSIVSRTFDKHLYKPLIHIKDSEIKVMPVVLNEGEFRLLDELARYHAEHADFFKHREIYLLRNLGRGHGVGFFQAHNFYPDFIMWIVEGRKQHILFLDPHGLLIHQGGFEDPKIAFHKSIKELERAVADPDVTLDSFIISVTAYEKLNMWGKRVPREDFEQNHILFQTDTDYLSVLFRSLTE